MPKKAETRCKAREELVAHSMFDPEVFKMRGGVLMFTKAANRNRMGEGVADMSPGINGVGGLESVSSK